MLIVSSSFPPTLTTSLTVQDVRALPGFSWRIDAQLHQLGLSDSSGLEGSDNDEESKQNGRNDRAKRGKKLRWRKTAKLKSWVLYPQVWPQSQLSLSYIGKAVPYDNLTLAEFAVRLASILRISDAKSDEEMLPVIPRL